MKDRVWCADGLRGLVFVASALVVLSPSLRLGAVLLRRAGLQVYHTVPLLFDLNQEGNFPSAFSALLWVLLAATAVLVALLDRPRRRGMLGLASVALLLGVDEAVSLHERLEGLGERVPGAPPYAWVLPGSLIAVVLVAVLARTVWSLPSPAPRLLLLGGAVFVSGAVVVETLGGIVFDRYGDGLLYVVETTLEEALELAGVLLALTGLLSLVDGPVNAPRLRASSVSVGTREASARSSASAPSGSAAREPSP